MVTFFFAVSSIKVYHVQFLQKSSYPGLVDQQESSAIAFLEVLFFLAFNIFVVTQHLCQNGGFFLRICVCPRGMGVKYL